MNELALRCVDYGRWEVVIDMRTFGKLVAGQGHLRDVKLDPPSVPGRTGITALDSHVVDLCAHAARAAVEVLLRDWYNHEQWERNTPPLAATIASKLGSAFVLEYAAVRGKIKDTGKPRALREEAARMVSEIVSGKTPLVLADGTPVPRRKGVV